MSVSNWQTFLIKEHSVLLKILEKIFSIVNSNDQEENANSNLQNLLKYLLDFGDKIHNVKEENHLFPLIVLHGVPQEGLIKQMLLDHEYEREFLARALLRLPSLAYSTSSIRKNFLKEVKQYCKKRRKHIQQENEKLYIQAMNIINDEDNQKLLSAFAIVDKKNNSNILLNAIESIIVS